MHSLDEKFLKSLTFTAEQLTILRTIFTIRLVLRQLKNEDVIISQGKGRNAKWIRKLT